MSSHRKDTDALANLAVGILEGRQALHGFAETFIQYIIDGEASDTGLVSYAEKQPPEVLEDFYNTFVEDDDQYVRHAIGLIRNLIDSGGGSGWNDDGSGFEDGTGFENEQGEAY